MLVLFIALRLFVLSVEYQVPEVPRILFVHISALFPLVCHIFNFDLVEEDQTVHDVSLLFRLDLWEVAGDFETLDRYFEVKRHLELLLERLLDLVAK